GCRARGGDRAPHRGRWHRPCGLRGRDARGSRGVAPGDDGLPAGARGGGGRDHRPRRRGAALRRRRSGAMIVIRTAVMCVVWAIAAIAMAACGGGDASPTPTPTPTATVAASPTVAPTEPPATATPSLEEIA